VFNPWRTTVMFGISRRQFLQVTAAGVAGLGLLGLGWIRTRRCPGCGTNSRGHAYRERGIGGVYCPACARNLSSGRWDVVPLASWSAASRRPHLRSVPAVPFPNPALLSSGDKPAVALSQVRLFRVRGAVGDLVLPQQGMAIRHARVDLVGTALRADPTPVWRHPQDPPDGQSDVFRPHGKRHRSSIVS
jgi:hypothetical protein